MQPYEQLEAAFAKHMSMPHMVVCSSGTAALHLAFEVLRIAKGWKELHNTDFQPQVAVPDTTMIACPRAVSMAGMIPIFGKVDELGLLNEVPTSADAVLAVHLYGRACPTQTLVKDLPVIEDCAEAHGLQPNPNSFAACWSFYQNKAIGGEEGGAVAFQEAEHAEIARELRTLGMGVRHDFMHRPRGMNYRLANALAIPILESLKVFGVNRVRRKRVETMYNVALPADWRLPKRQFPWVFDLELPEGIDTWQVAQQLVARGVNARQCFKPMTWQLEYENRAVTCENAKRIAERRIYLPIRPYLNQQQATDIVKVLIDTVETMTQGYPLGSSS